MLLDLTSKIDQEKAKAYLGKLIEQGEKVEIRKISKQRTSKQNAYLHVCLGLFCIETGYKIEEAKELFSRHLPEIMRYEKMGNNFRKSTSELDTREMTILIDFIRETALNELGLYIPTAEEYLTEKFRIDRDLERGITFT